MNIEYFLYNIHNFLENPRTLLIPLIMFIFHNFNKIKLYLISDTKYKKCDYINFDDHTNNNNTQKITKIFFDLIQRAELIEKFNFSLINGIKFKKIVKQKTYYSKEKNILHIKNEPKKEITTSKTENNVFITIPENCLLYSLNYKNHIIYFYCKTNDYDLTCNFYLKYIFIEIKNNIDFFKIIDDYIIYYYNNPELENLSINIGKYYLKTIEQEQSQEKINTYKWNRISNISTKLDFQFSNIKKIKDRIDNFFRNSEFYESICKTQRMTFYIWGTPGLGKSHLISNISSKYNLGIYYMSFKEGLTETEYFEMFNKIPMNSLIVLDDIDLTLLNKENKTWYHLFLQLLDSNNSKQNQITIITSNENPKDLDPALLRPGRIDFIEEIRNINKDDIKLFFNTLSEKLNVKESYNLDKILELPNITPAKLINLINLYDFNKTFNDFIETSYLELQK